MRLNPDCIRDILLTVEETVDFSTHMQFPAAEDYPTLSEYPHEEVLYHVKQCELSGFLTKVTWYIGSKSGCLIFDLSPAGHAFLENVRSDTNWTKTKDIAKSVGSTSLDALTKIATSVISTIISAQFK